MKGTNLKNGILTTMKPKNDKTNDCLDKWKNLTRVIKPSYIKASCIMMSHKSNGIFALMEDGSFELKRFL